MATRSMHGGGADIAPDDAERRPGPDDFRRIMAIAEPLKASGPLATLLQGLPGGAVVSIRVEIPVESER